MFCNRKKGIASAKPPEFIVSLDDLHKSDTRQLLVVKARIAALEPLADRLSGQRASTFTGKDDIDFFVGLSDLRASEAGLIFDIDKYKKQAEGAAYLSTIEENENDEAS